MSLDFKRILCPADLSTFSLEAVKLAVKVAENSGATLYMLHVIDSPFDDLYMSSITEADPALLEMYQNEPAKRAEVLRRTVAHSEILLKQFCHPWVESLPKVRYLVSTGNAFDRTRHAWSNGSQEDAHRQRGRESRTACPLSVLTVRPRRTTQKPKS